jgi:molybdenum cofactor guanylyltransferase
MIDPVDCVTAFVLAGGKSSRMGEDKASLQFRGKTFLQRALDNAARVAEEVCIVGDPNKFLAFGRVVEDVFPECGPLGGIHAALRQTKSVLNLMLAVDLPFVEEGFLRYLISTARQCDALVTVARAGGGFQPLCAVYRQEFVDVAERSLREGRNKIDPLFDLVQTRVLEEEALASMGFSAGMFRNLNTPEEFAQAQKDTRRQERRA